MRVAEGLDTLVVKSIAGGFLAQTRRRREARPRASAW